jgi:hypothetical protein
MKEFAMRKYFILTLLISLAVIMVFAVWGCKNPDNGVDPSVPDPQGDYPTGDPADPPITPPFSHASITGAIFDIGIQGDGDLVFATGTGLQVFTPYGVFKRTINPGIYYGIISSSYSAAFHSGKGIIAVGPPNACNSTFYYDDEYVQQGVAPPRFAHCNDAWWDGLPDPGNPPWNPVDYVSTSEYVSCEEAPQGITHHPFTNFLFQLVFTPTCKGDPDVAWPDPPGVDEVPFFFDGILAYDPTAPLPPTGMDMFWEGGVDFVVYYDASVYTRIQMVLLPMYPVVPACAIQNSPIIWDQLSMSGMSDRPGMNVSNITDIQFDALSRLVMVVQGGDAIAISDPVVFPNPMIIQRVVGGRQNGMGTLPGEFQGPRAVAIDPRNQNILISDTGNSRVQVFDNDGNFIREFGAAYTWVPGAICVDAFGTIYISDIANGGLVIQNEHGSSIQYGTIEGWVYDKYTQLPINNAAVFIMSTFDPQGAIFTDPDGHFYFPAVPSGTHNVVVEKYGFFSANLVTTVNAGGSSQIDVYLTRDSTHPPGFGQVTGTVLSDKLYGEPLPGLTVSIVGEAVSNVTNPDGEFILYQVPEGPHTLKLSAVPITGPITYLEMYIYVEKGEIVNLGVIYLHILPDDIP